MANYVTGENTKNNIILAAKDLFYEKGYIATSYSDICKVINIKKGNLQYHFNTKELLCVDVCSSFYETLYREATKIACATENKYLETMLVMFIFWYKFYKDEKIRRFVCESLRNNINTEVFDYFTYYLNSLEKKEIEVDFFSLAACKAIERSLPELLIGRITEHNYLETSEFVMYTYASYIGPDETQCKATLDQAKKLLSKFDMEQLSMGL